MICRCPKKIATLEPQLNTLYIPAPLGYRIPRFVRERPWSRAQEFLRRVGGESRPCLVEAIRLHCRFF